MHDGTVFGVENPTLLHDIPQLRVDLERPLECAVTVENDLGNAATGMITVVRPLARKHLVDHARPRIDVCFWAN